MSGKIKSEQKCSESLPLPSRQITSWESRLPELIIVRVPERRERVNRLH